MGAARALAGMGSSFDGRMSCDLEDEGYWRLICVSYREVVVFIIGLAAAIALGALLGPAFNSWQLSGCKPLGHLNISEVFVAGDSSIVTLRTGALQRQIVYSNVQDTHSMQPVIGGNSTVIRFVPEGSSDIKLCDMVEFGTAEKAPWALHRIVEIGQDEEGTYYVTKGDNNNLVADRKVRFKDIHYVVLAVVY